MKKPPSTSRLLALALASILTAAPAFAKGGDEHGKGHGKDKHEQQEQKQQERHGADRRVEDVRVGGYFNDEHRNAVRHYYSEQYGSGKACPPGLAKKHNGCMPPGQARKLAVGERVPTGVTLYPVPRPVIVQLPPPPYGYRYARVGNDIVLVRNNNQVIVDIIAGLLG